MDCINEVVNVVYAESRGEGIKGMEGVLHVIINRASEKGVRPCIIIKQKNQFAPGIHNPKDPTWQVAKRLVLSPGVDITKGAKYFHTLRVRPKWAYRFKVTYRFGNHIFYRT